MDFEAHYRSLWRRDVFLGVLSVGLVSLVFFSVGQAILSLVGVVVSMSTGVLFPDSDKTGSFSSRIFRDSRVFLLVTGPLALGTWVLTDSLLVRGFVGLGVSQILVMALSHGVLSLSECPHPDPSHRECPPHDPLYGILWAGVLGLSIWLWTSSPWLASVGVLGFLVGLFDHLRQDGVV